MENPLKRAVDKKDDSAIPCRVNDLVHSSASCRNL